MRNTISWINIKRKKRNIEKIIIITKTQSDILRSEIIRNQENKECFILFFISIKTEEKVTKLFSFFLHFVVNFN